jgi:hypothetical protein
VAAYTWVEVNPHAFLTTVRGGSDQLHALSALRSGKCNQVLSKQVSGPENRLEYLEGKTGFVPLPGKEPRHLCHPVHTKSLCWLTRSVSLFLQTHAEIRHGNFCDHWTRDYRPIALQGKRLFANWTFCTVNSVVRASLSYSQNVCDWC